VKERTIEAAWPRTTRMALVAACFAMLGLEACKTAPTASAPPGQGATTAAPAAPVPAPPPPEPAPPAVRPLSPEEMRPALETVRNQLDQGHEDTALEMVQRILATDANHKVANGYQRQIKEDPVALYGAEHTTYRVAAGDTLASIAQRAPALKDRDQFYGLARYNDMKVPRQLQAGQVLKIPGKVPMPGTTATTPTRETPRETSRETAAAPSPSSAATPAPPAAAPTPPAAAPAPAPAATPATPTAAGASPAGDGGANAMSPKTPAAAPVAAGPSAADKQRLDQCMREARRAQERHEPCIAIERWECVLRIDPTNRVAEVERERALQVKRRLPNPSC
jgi:LysM repeat protein